MILTNRPDESQTYSSRAWRTTSCPDIATVKMMGPKQPNVTQNNSWEEVTKNQYFWS